MKYAILSDIHSNVSAFQEVYRDTQQKGVDGYIFLGDFIGYLASPKGVLEILKSILEKHPDSYWVLGNHEKLLQVAIDTQDSWDVEFPELENQAFAQIGKLEEAIRQRLMKGSASTYAVDSLYRNLKEIDETELLSWFLDEIITDSPRYEQIIKLKNSSIFQIKLVHGESYIWPWDSTLLKHSLVRPYLENGFKKADCNLILFGHTHMPTFYQVDHTADKSVDQEIVFQYGTSYSVDGLLSVINPGSVGLPRDSDHRASYVILDTEKKEIVFYRLSYDLDRTSTTLLEKRYCDEMTKRLFEASVPTPRGNRPPPEYLAQLSARSKNT